MKILYPKIIRDAIRDAAVRLGKIFPVMILRDTILPDCLYPKTFMTKREVQ